MQRFQSPSPNLDLASSGFSLVCVHGGGVSHECMLLRMNMCALVQEGRDYLSQCWLELTIIRVARMASRTQGSTCHCFPSTGIKERIPPCLVFLVGTRARSWVLMPVWPSPQLQAACLTDLLFLSDQLLFVLLFPRCLMGRSLLCYRRQCLSDLWVSALTQMTPLPLRSPMFLGV